MKIISIKAEKRKEAGKKSASALRRQDKIPAIMYGGDSQQKLAVNTKEVFKALSGKEGKNVILEIGIEGDGPHNTILKELQYHPITDKLLHADFLEIDLEKPLQKRIPIVLDGEPVGVKIKGGVIRFHFRNINVECMPEMMPDSIRLDVSNLDIDQKVTVGEIQVPDEVTKLDDPKTRIVSVGPPKVSTEEVSEVSAEAEAEAKTETTGETEADKK